MGRGKVIHPISTIFSRVRDFALTVAYVKFALSNHFNDHGVGATRSNLSFLVKEKVKIAFEGVPKMSGVR